MENKNELILSVNNLKKHFPIYKGLLRRVEGFVYAVDDISFEVEKGSTLGLVGESGCGKTTVAKCILRIEEPTAGSICFEDKDINKVGSEESKQIRRNTQIIFQDPYSSLNPRINVETIVGEPLYLNGVSYVDRQKRVKELLDLMGLGDDAAKRFPHEFSGGQRQRICIARALALKPKLIVCDEPTSALDVSIQSQILNLLLELQSEFFLTYILVSHDLSVVRHISDQVVVMYLGEIMEIGSAEEIYNNPTHPYTRALLSSAPQVEKGMKEEIELKGDIPSPSNPPCGCRFHTRCFLAEEKCKVKKPEFKEVSPGHNVSCHFV